MEFSHFRLIFPNRFGLQRSKRKREEWRGDKRKRDKSDDGGEVERRRKRDRERGEERERERGSEKEKKRQVERVRGWCRTGKHSTAQKRIE